MTESEAPEVGPTEGCEDISKILNIYATHSNIDEREKIGGILLDLLTHRNLDEILNHIHDIVATILMVAEDKTSRVKYNLIDNIPHIFQRCHEHACPGLEHYLYDCLLQIMFQSLQDVDYLSYTALAGLRLIMEKGLIDKKRLEEKVCPNIINLLPDDFSIREPEYHRKASLTLMTCAAREIGPQKTEEFFIERFLELYKCPVIEYRKCYAKIFPTICNVMGTEYTERKLLDIYLDLCNDEDVSVQQDAAESIAVMSLMCSPKSRREKLAPVVLKLTQEEPKWAATTVYKVLGPFISTFADPSITGISKCKGKVFMVNWADADFRTHAPDDLMENFKHYMDMFTSELEETSTNNDNENENNECYEEALNCNEIAELLFKNKEQLRQQIIDIVYTSKPVAAQPGVRMYPGSAIDWNLNKSSSDEEGPLFFNPQEIRIRNLKKKDLESGDMLSSHSSTDVTNVVDVSKSLPSIQNFKSMHSSSPTTTPVVSAVNSCKPSKYNYKYKKEESQQEQSQSNVNNSNKYSIGLDNSTTGVSPRRTHVKLEHFHHWKKNTPEDLSSIIKNAIKALDDDNKTNNCGEQNMEIPETPCCETLEHKNISYENCNNKNQVGEEENDNDKNKNKDYRNGIETEEEDEAFQDYNSHKYWYISPELPCLNLESIEDSGVGGVCVNNNSTNDDCNSDTNNINNNYNYYQNEEEDFHQGTIFSQTFSSNATKDGGYITKYEDASFGTDTSLSSSEKERLVNSFKFGLDNSGGTEFKPPSNFDQDIVPPEILKAFVMMVVHEEGAEITCAYNFPAVTLTLGRKNWHLLKGLLQHLCDDIDWKVRKTIALSIDWLALILGKEIATNDLLPIYLGFFKDLDEVKIEAIRNTASFLRKIDHSKYNEVLSNIGICLRMDNKTNWRIKEDLARQIILIVKMCAAVKNYNNLRYLTSLAGILLEDKISCIREIAADAMVEIIRISSLAMQEAIMKIFLLQEFGLSSCWRKRQTFLNIVLKLLKTDPPMLNLFYMVNDIIKRLSSDPVSNVRLLIAKTLVQLIKIKESIVQESNDEDADIMKVLRKLQEDDDRYVREISGGTEKECFNSEEETTTSPNNLNIFESTIDEDDDVSIHDMLNTSSIDLEPTTGSEEILS